MVYEATFWEADIEIDAILSHSWLLENKIGVFPHHKALALDASNLRLLYGIKHKEKKLPERVPICTARMKKMRLVEKRKKWRLKGSYVVGDENEDMGNVEWDLDGMSLPQEGFDQKTLWLNAEERNIVRRRLQRAGDCVRQRALIVANKPVESNEQSQKYSDKIIEKYKDTVLTGKVLPNPPVRGPYGYAYIPLKEGAKPFRA